MWFIIILIFVLFLIHHYFIKPLKFWEEKYVQHEKAFPIFGSMLPVVLQKCSHTELFLNMYRKHPNERYVGLHNYTTPALMVRDPELIKKVMVKEFETFPEHIPFVPSDVDPLWSNNLFAMEGGDKWHQLRSTLSPSFTSSKMKTMFVLMKECSKKFVTYYKSKGESMDVELKETFTRFGNDVIASTAFGVTCNSLSNPKSEFYILAKELIHIGLFRRLALFINLISPTLSRIGRLSFFPKRTKRFFTALVKDTLITRKEKNIIRPDMLHLLMESQKGNLKNEEDTQEVTEAGFAVAQESDFSKANRKSKFEITDEIITAQVVIFIFAGFETVSTMLSYTVYELALNPDIQKRLRDEIDGVNGELTYDNLMGMKYLDNIISESLRKWPPFIILDRRSTRPYTIEPEEPNESPVLLGKHSSIIFPVFSIHRDSKYYPNPDKFDPERFNEENRNNIQPYTYIPFGAGPRNCIGSRFALLEGKLIVAEIVKNFELFPIAKTQNPIVFSKTNFNPLPDDGIWVGFEQRKLD